MIYCERETHKGMLIGKKGEMLKRIGTQAREDAERFLGAKINLQCWVKVKEDWRNRKASSKTSAMWMNKPGSPEFSGYIGTLFCQTESVRSIWPEAK